MSEKVHVEAVVNRTLQDVWTLWNEPEHITNWYFASGDWCCPRAENDLRVGGSLFIRLESKDGSFGFDFEAVYDAVVDQAKLSYTMTDRRQVETRFVDLGQKTRVSTQFDAENENPRDMQRDGWQAILNNFKKYAESQ